MTERGLFLKDICMLQNDYLEGKKKTNICLSVSLSVFDEIHSFFFFFYYLCILYKVVKCAKGL